VSSATHTPHRILCVDDRVTSLEVRRALLKQMGYEVLIASDPAGALAIFDDTRIDLVLLDYSFPGQMSGDELARQLRARKPDVPLIMLSGYPDLPATVAGSVDALLLKGSSQPSDLLNAIQRLLRGPRPAGSQPAAETPATPTRNRNLREQSKELMKQSKSLMARDKSGPQN